MMNPHDIELTELEVRELSQEELDIAPDDAAVLLGRMPEWTRKVNDEPYIERTYEFQDFTKALDFVKAVAEVAEAENHHPDIDIRYSRVRLALTSHDVGGLTLADFIVAAKIDTLV